MLICTVQERSIIRTTVYHIVRSVPCNRLQEESIMHLSDTLASAMAGMQGVSVCNQLLPSVADIY